MKTELDLLTPEQRAEHDAEMKSFGRWLNVVIWGSFGVFVVVVLSVLFAGIRFGMR